MKNKVFQKSINQINFILTRFNFTSEHFAEEINFLLTNYKIPLFDPSSFADKLLARLHHLLILESWTLEPPYFTNEQQVQALQRLRRILDLNDWLELVCKTDPANYDPLPYQLRRKRTISRLQQLIQSFHSPAFGALASCPPVGTCPKLN